MFPARPLLALVLCSFLVSPPPILAQAKPTAQPGKVLTLEDLYRLDHPQTPILSPDGRRLAYIRHWFDGTGKQERHSLWLVDRSPEKAKPLEAGEPDARSPAFSPDGQWIAYRFENQDAGVYRLMRMHPDGRKRAAIVTLPFAPRGIDWGVRPT